MSVTLLSASGYYYELDDSYDESDEEEVRAHLRRVAEQPPLKLEDSTEVKHQPTLNTLPDGGKHRCTLLFFFHSEIGLPRSVWPDYHSPARGAGAAEEEKEEEDAQGAQSLTLHITIKAHSSSSTATQHPLHAGGDGPGTRTGGQEAVPHHVQTVPCHHTAEKR